MMSPGAQQGLLDHLVRGGSAVGDKEHVVRPECTGSLFLRNLDVSSGLKQAIEATCGCGGLRKKEGSVHRTGPCRESSFDLKMDLPLAIGNA